MNNYKFLLCNLAVLFGQDAFTQNHDIHFLNRSTPHGSGAIIRYNDEINDIELDTFQWNGTVSGSQTFSDKNGNFLCYYNCRNVYDSIGRVAINGDSMAVGFFQNYLFSFLPPDEGLGNRTNCAFIPITDSLFYLLYTSSELWSGAKDFEVDYEENGYSTTSYSKGLYLSKLRLRSDNRIAISQSEKHTKLTNELYQYNNLITCKHANGEDWWIIIPHAMDEKADVFLLTNEGEINEYSDIEFSNNYWRIRSDSEFAFSEDGTLMARLIVRPIEKMRHLVEIFRFDRCEGKLEMSEVDSIELPEVYTTASDVIFSDNGRFLYIGIGSIVLQYELNSFGEIVSKDIVGVWDGYLYQDFLQPIFDVFWKLPNGKILVASGISTPFLHIIKEPNLPGILCEFSQRAYRFPDDALNFPLGVDIERLPRYPDYRMKPHECTTGVEEVKNPAFVNIYPTITAQFIYLDKCTFSTVLVFDALGNRLVNDYLQMDEVNKIDLSSFASGVYFISIMDGNKLIQTTRIIKL